ncbi:MAG: 16S rRNA (guanine(966)-N(2))-methyltransferase RsmD [Eubacteriales bacterium]
MRIISGKYRGRKLVAPEGQHTRPTTDRVKEALFGALQFRLHDAKVLDLFAGSGALGIEALSRGAKSCLFVENNRAALKALEENLARIEAEYEVHAVDYMTGLKRLDGKSFDLIFMDPPYTAGYYEPALAFIAEHDLLDEDGVLVLEIKTGMSSGGEKHFDLVKTKTYGAVTLETYERKGKA